MRRWSLTLPILGILSCSSRVDREVRPPSQVASLAKRHPAAASLLNRTRGATGGVLRAQGLVVSQDARGLVLRRADDPRVVRVLRSGTASVEGGALVHVSASETAATFVDGAAVEDLVETHADLDYRLELPPGFELRAACEHCNIVELLDPAGRAFLRVAAPLAWDSGGRRHVPAVKVAGDHVRITVDAAAPRPLLVDPLWTTPSVPALPRQGHATTPLGDGRLLITGGGTSVTEYFDPQTGRFHLGPALAASRGNHTATLLMDGRVLIAGGRGSTALATTELLDPSANTVVSGPTLAAARAWHTATLLTNGKVLLAGGESGASVDTTEIFDPSSSSLSAGVKLKAARARHTATRVVSGRVALVGGATTRVSEILDVAASTTSDGATLSENRTVHATLELSDGRLLVMGGAPTGVGFIALSTTELCPLLASPCAAGPDLSIGREGPAATWLPLGSIAATGGIITRFEGLSPAKGTDLLTATTSTAFKVESIVPHYLHTATLLPSGDVFVLGGAEPSADILVSDRSGFRKVGDLGSTRLGGRSVLLPTGKVLLFGADVISGGSSTAELFDPATQKWSVTGKLGAVRADARAIGLDDGKVLVVGSDGGPAASSAELYDPSTGVFTAVASAMASARARPSLTRLPSGKILVAGGGTSTAELFDPKAGTFAATGPLTRARKDHAAVLLRDGRVLVAGGSGDTVVEVYQEDGTFVALSAPMGLRTECRGALLPSGRVLFVGGSARQGDLFDPATNSFSATALAADAHFRGGLAVLPTGKVLVTSGGSGPYGSVSLAEVFDEASGSGGGFVRVSDLVAPRLAAATTLLDDGGVLLAGGAGCALCVLESTAEVFDERWKLKSATLTTPPTKATAGTPIDLVGTGFVASPEPTSGTTGSGATTPPMGVFVPLGGDAVIFGRTLSWTATTMRWVPPATARLGPGQLFILVRGVPSAAVRLNLEPATAGSGCAANAACASGYCVDGVCCDTACKGVCEACTAARKGSGVDGVCGAVPPEKDPKDFCVLGLGAKCSTDAQCTTGVCVDGVCCNARCDGQCEACDVEGTFGTCVPAVGVPHGARAACADATTADSCTAKICDGKGRAGCDGFVGSKVSCRAASCAAGIATLPARCDGSGACPAAVTKNCTPYACAADGCGGGSCARETDCAPDYRCAIAAGAVRGDCVVRTDAYCVDDRTSVSRDGTKKVCDPYRCTPTGCGNSCNSSNDCLGGFACDTTSKTCVSADAAVGASGGCSTGASTGVGAFGAWLLALACLGRVGRRDPAAR